MKFIVTKGRPIAVHNGPRSGDWKHKIKPGMRIESSEKVQAKRGPWISIECEHNGVPLRGWIKFPYVSVIEDMDSKKDSSRRESSNRRESSSNSLAGMPTLNFNTISASVAPTATSSAAPAAPPAPAPGYYYGPGGQAYDPAAPPSHHTRSTSYPGAGAGFPGHFY